MRTGVYRIRKSLFGKSILQELDDSPMLMVFGIVDSSFRIKKWKDVPYAQAPAMLAAATKDEEKEQSK